PPPGPAQLAVAVGQDVGAGVGAQVADESVASDLGHGGLPSDWLDATCIYAGCILVAVLRSGSRVTAKPPSSEHYGEQRRGDRDCYRRYLDGMDASMRQKVALTAAHLLCEGRIADMGMGSGSGSLALASLYPALEVIGVDVSETMVRLAEERHPLPHLRFQVGGLAQPVL